MALNLPPEISFRLLDELDPSSLAARCATDRKIAHLCADSYFWKNKGRSLTRRQIQNDWVVVLAQKGEERLLGYLLDAIESEGIVLDQWVIALILMHLHVQNSTGKIVQRLEAMIDDELEFVSDLLEHEVGEASLRDYALRLKQQIDDALNYWKKNNWGVSFLHISSFDKPDSNFVFSFIDEYLETVGSPSSVVGMLRGSPSMKIATNILEFLRLYLVPYYARMGRVDSLILYAKDIVALDGLIKEVMIYNNWPRNRIKWYLATTIIDFMSLDQIKEILGEQWTTHVANMTLNTERRDVFIEGAKAVHYNYVARGYVTMEPDEWLNWFERLPPLVDRHSIINYTLDEARWNGYSHFFYRVLDYAKKNGYWTA